MEMRTIRPIASGSEIRGASQLTAEVLDGYFRGDHSVALLAAREAEVSK